MKEKLILIGASTGGPGHLKKILIDLPAWIDIPIIIAQHMGVMFIPSFIDQFKNELKAPVFSLKERKTLDKGGIYICEKNFIIKSNNPLRATPQESDEKTLYNPNVDILFNSAVKLCNEVEIMPILLTGIGHDGADGLKNLAKNGAYAIGESEKSAIVYGMPKKAKELNPDLRMLELSQIKIELEKFLHVL